MVAAGSFGSLFDGSVALTGKRYDDGSGGFDGSDSTGDSVVRVEVADGLIKSVTEASAAGSAPSARDSHSSGGSTTNKEGTIERWLIPGFYDLQLNGFAGIDLADPALTTDRIRELALCVLRTGCTRFLPTIITDDLDAMCRALQKLAAAMADDPLIAAMCPGIHAEGPFINPEDGPRGAHPRQFVRPPSVADFHRLYDASGRKLRILTLAPEQPGAVEVIKAASQLGVVVALGHHRADRAAIDAAVRAGARMTTHLGNGADAMLPRTDNCVWSQLGEDRLWASIIADGHHLPPPALRSIIRAKTLDRVVLVTDAMAAAGMPPGRFKVGGNEVVRTPEGKVCLPGTPYLAGSCADMLDLITCSVRDAGLSFAEAVRLAALQPGRLVPTAIDPWSMTPGKPANLVELCWDPAIYRATVERVVIGRFAMDCR